MKRGVKPLYLWDKWFTLKRFVLRRGKHYRCSHSTMSGQVRNAASKRGLSVSVDELEGIDGTFLLVTVRDADRGAYHELPDLFGEELAAST